MFLINITYCKAIRFCVAMFVLVCSLNAFAQHNKFEGIVVDEQNMPVDCAFVLCYGQDSSIVKTCITDSTGFFCVDTDLVVKSINIGRIGYVSHEFQPPFPSSYLLKSDSLVLSNVVVKGKASFIKETETGFVYELGNNEYAKHQNLLQAMRFVPMIDVSFDGKLSVVGQKKFVIYLNGKHYDIAERNTTQFLQSLSAKDVKRIEVVTMHDKRFLLNNEDVVVINIICEKKLIDGISVNISSVATSQPTLKSGSSVIGKKGNVDFSLSYNYDWNTQRSQPIEQDYFYSGCSSFFRGFGDGDWHNHIGRAMVLWQINALNTIYTDIHTKVQKTDFLTKWDRLIENNSGLYDKDILENQNENTSGTIETNVIYRNFYPDASASERLSLGYRYTYNPDIRHFNQKLLGKTNIPQFDFVKTDGGMYEHIINAKFSGMFLPGCQTSVGTKGVYRSGESSSSYMTRMSYNQTLLYPYISFIGSKYRINYSLNLSAEYDYMKMNSFDEEHFLASNSRFYLTPSIEMSRVFGGIRVVLNYKRSTTRPTILMLNPFRSTINGMAENSGNPHLKAEVKDNYVLSLSRFTKKIYCSTGINYSHSYDAILYHQCKDNEHGRIISTYDNIGKVSRLIGNVYFQWQPISAFVVKLSVNGGYYGLKVEDNIQSDYTLGAFGWVDYYMPKGWHIGINLQHFKQEPEPYSTIGSITQYSFQIGKSWFDGRLSAGFEMKTPFQKYVVMDTHTETADFVVGKKNYMVARSVGLNVTYSFNKGKRAKITRDKSIKHSDQQTGVE